MLRSLTILLLHTIIPCAGTSAGEGGNALDEVYQAIETHYVRDVDRTHFTSKTIEATLAELDPHCRWISPEEAERLHDAMRGMPSEKPMVTVHGPIFIEGKIATIRIDAFGTDTARALRAAVFLACESEAEALVLDLRFNRGGLLVAGVEVADAFIAKGPIVHVTGRDRQRHTYSAKNEGTQSNLPLVVLVNRDTASTAEVVASCLQDSGRAAVCGERTHGKGSMQSLIDLPSGGMIKLTTAYYERPSGKNIDRHAANDAGNWGVTPNAGLEVHIEDGEYRELASRWYDADDMIISNDQSLDRAVRYLQSQPHAPSRPRNDL